MTDDDAGHAGAAMTDELQPTPPEGAPAAPEERLPATRPAEPAPAERFTAPRRSRRPPA